MGLFQQSKLYLVENLHLARDALHIYVALIIFVGACLMFGWKARDWRPFRATLVRAPSHWVAPAGCHPSSN